VFLLVRDREKIEKCRPDVKLDRKFEGRKRLFFEFAGQLGFVPISNDGDPEQALAAILEDMQDEGKKAS
jgi:hypothetical protein